MDGMVGVDDHSIHAYSESTDMKGLTVNVTAGVPGATADVVVWKGGGAAETWTVVLDAKGTGQLAVPFGG